LLLVGPVLAQSAGRSPLAADARLDKHVTVRWKKATLFEALKELSKSTGAQLAPDRTLVDEPVMISATDVPARQVLDQMGTLLHFTWVRSGGKPDAPNYLLFQDRLARQEEQDEIDGGRRAVIEALEKEVDRLRKLSRMAPGDFQRETERADRELEDTFSKGIASIGSDANAGQRLLGNMSLYAVASPVGRVMVSVLDNLTPGQWQQLMEERPLIMSSQPGEGETALPAGMNDSLRNAAPQLPFPKALFRTLGPQVEAGVGEAEKMMQEPWSRAQGFKITVRLSLTVGSQPVGMLNVSPEPLGVEGGMGPLFQATGLNIIGTPASLTEQLEDPTERAKRLAADPLLGKVAELKLPPLQAQMGFMAILGKSYRVAEILGEVETAYGVHLLGDAYNKQAFSVIQPPTGPQPLYKLLDDMAGTSRRWERAGDLIRFRSRTWAHDRRSEIPTRYMQRWLTLREKQGGFNLDDVAEIATLLRDEQVDSLMFSAIECEAKDMNDFIMVTTNRDPLRVYGRLLPAQRKHLANGGTLAARSLYPYQQRTLLNLGNAKGGGGMFAMMSPGKTPRRPEQLAEGVLSLAVNGANAPARPGAAPAPKLDPPGPTRYQLSLSYPNGQKDEYSILLSHLAPVPPAPTEQ
jgi:hypothetical protein